MAVVVRLEGTSAGITCEGLEGSNIERLKTASDSGEVPVEVLAWLMGHTDTKTTGFYLKVRDKRALRAAKTIKMPTTKSEAG